jgi:hypothetical protein
MLLKRPTASFRQEEQALALSHLRTEENYLNMIKTFTTDKQQNFT